MRNFLFGFLLFPLLAFLFYWGGERIWYPYYKHYFIHKDIKPIALSAECNRTHCERNNRPKAWNPYFLKTPQPLLDSKQRLKHLLADSDFIIYPKKLTLIGLKHERSLEVWGEINHQWRRIHTYAFTGFSGRLGPKLKEGDHQIPEGIYRINYLNPNSKFHLALRINYPNEFDQRVAKQDKRPNLGSDIMIHGSNVTIGCIPIGNDNIEELYYLVEKVGIQNAKVILSPVDFRVRKVEIGNKKYPWLSELYSQISQELKSYQ